MGFIKTSGGITFAQDKRSAKFFQMPHSAIIAGVVDFILPPAGIASELGRIPRNHYLHVSKYNDPEEIIPGAEAEISRIFRMLNSSNGVDFKDYKPTTVKRRILRRMLVHKIDNIKNYLGFLKKNPKELNALHDDILINVTSFFRDPGMYETLKSKIFPHIFKNKDHNNPIRIWVTACSTGEEAYSMAIALIEFLGDKLPRVPIQIFSTDLSDKGIAKARSGIYPEDIRNDVSPERLGKYFTRKDGKYQINKSIREMCIFAKQNIIQDPPFSKIDLVSCRNVLIYLGQVLQNKVIPVFHYSLNKPGYMVLGSSESIGTFTNLFEQVDKKNKIFKKKDGIAKLPIDFSRIRIGIPPNNNNNNNNNISNGLKKHSVSEEDFKRTADSILLNKFAPASVIINSDFDIIQFRGKTNGFLEFPQGEPSYNLLKIAREGLSADIRILLKKIQKNNMPGRKNDIEINSNGSAKNINLSISPLGNANSPKLYLVVFEEVNKNGETESGAAKSNREKPESAKILSLKEELGQSKQNLQSNIEQLESSNEELRAANEEIQSSNEELQSTNEELETAKEELQSSNEELTTVNEELHNRNSELSGVNNDLSNLLGSINIPIVILDETLIIKRYTSKAEKLLNLIPTDIGRKISDLKINIKISNLKKLVDEVIKTPTVKELTVTDHEDCWYSMRIRPYMTLENKIEGVIIAFIDITDLKDTLTKLEDSKSEIEALNVNVEKRVVDRTKKLGDINKDLKEEIYERKHAEESLRILSKHLVNAQEAERQRLSRELHDSINQILSVVKMKLYSTESFLNKGNREPGKHDKQVLKDVLDARTLLESAIGELRNISKNLRPLALEELSLKSALQSIIDEFIKRTHIRIRFSICRFKKRLPQETELHLYRIVQEALHNMEKHSKASSGIIVIEANKTSITLKIKDNGKGFTPNSKKIKNIAQDKFGLIGMKERAESIGGTFEVVSKPGKGTEIKIISPINVKE